MDAEKTRKKMREKIRKEIEVPDKVTASVEGQILTLKGPKGETSIEIKSRLLSLRLEEGKIALESGKPTKENRKILGSFEAHIKNMIHGVLEPHNYTLKICSGHFPMTVSVTDNTLTIKNFLGEKVPRVLHLKKGAIVKVEAQLIHVTSANKEIAGQVAADIEQLTRRPGFDSRVFQDGCYLINKGGKELK